MRNIDIKLTCSPWYYFSASESSRSLKPWYHVTVKKKDNFLPSQKIKKCNTTPKFICMYDTIMWSAVSSGLFILLLESSCQSHKINSTSVIMFRKPPRLLQFHWKYYVFFFTSAKHRVLAALSISLCHMLLINAKFNFHYIFRAVLQFCLFVYSDRKKAGHAT